MLTVDEIEYSVYHDCLSYGFFCLRRIGIACMGWEKQHATTNPYVISIKLKSLVLHSSVRVWAGDIMSLFSRWCSNFICWRVLQHTTSI